MQNYCSRYVHTFLILLYAAVLVSTVGLRFFSNRRLVMLGGALHGFCFIITAVAKHIGVLYWFRGILNGKSFLNWVYMYLLTSEKIKHLNKNFK